MGAVAIDTSLKRRFAFYEAYIGKKLVMAVTGVILFGYVIGHLLGNLQVFLPPRIVNGERVYQINTYAGLLHSSAPLLWCVRSALIAAVVLHIWSSFLLWLQKRRARPIGYVKTDVIAADYASRTMIWSGPIIGAFIVFHILHLTAGTIGLGVQEATLVASGHEQYHAFENLVHGFRQPLVAIAYIVAMTLLSTHLYHGIWSMFQSVGINHTRLTPALQRLSHWLAILICLGFISIPISIVTGLVGCEVPR
jgi:succinate dehydrogenase / fumarate reductase cytochrome b subunit